MRLIAGAWRDRRLYNHRCSNSRRGLLHSRHSNNHRSKAVINLHRLYNSHFLRRGTQIVKTCLSNGIANVSS